MNHEHNTMESTTTGGIVYTCPMHPNIVRTMPGMCPECGMALVAKKSKSVYAQDTRPRHSSGDPSAIRSQKSDAGHNHTHDKHEGHHTEAFLKKFWVVLVLTVPILLYSEIFARAFVWQPPQFEKLPFVMLALGSIVFFYGGSVFLLGAYRELR
ncbi:MAG: heavy metal-binding domain-containing protein, partial [Patescibacteria group bacterium]